MQADGQKKQIHIAFILLILAGLLVLVNLSLFSTIAISESTGATSSNSLSLGLMPKGVPEKYGKELGVSYDDVSAANPRLADATIERLGYLDTQINLTPAQLERYIDILYEKENGISCEYCCGARSIIFENGQAACGCAHSYAMRGLAKYLIVKYGNDVSDEFILEELAKWKFLFFPLQMQYKAEVLKASGIESSYINIGSNKYRGIERRNA